MNQIGRHGWCTWLLVCATAATGLGCSDDDGNDGNQGGSGSSGGSANTSGAGGYGGRLAPDEVPSCRTGEPVEPSQEFSALQGEHPFTLDAQCSVDGVTFAANEAHRAVVIADAQRIEVIPAGSATGLSYSWDGARDLACKGEYSEYLELDGHGRYVRVAFLNGKPSIVLLGVCLGDASP